MIFVRSSFQIETLETERIGNFTKYFKNKYKKMKIFLNLGLDHIVNVAPSDGSSTSINLHNFLFYFDYIII